jgi:hypothetical protein
MIADQETGKPFTTEERREAQRKDRIIGKSRDQEIETSRRQVVSRELPEAAW